MKPIHNEITIQNIIEHVVIPHKVNDLNETNSQPFFRQVGLLLRCDSSQS